jgi:hypothetical protein
VKWTVKRARRSSLDSVTSEADAIMINAPTLGGWYLLQGKAGAISCATDIYALLFSGLSLSKGERGEIGVARIECSRTQCQKHCEEDGDDGKRPLAIHGPAPLDRKKPRVWSDTAVRH